MTPALHLTSRGDEVLRLQLILREMNFALRPDGFFGHMTREAVKTFQALHALPATGLVEPRTWDALEAAFTQIPHNCPCVFAAQ